MNKIEVAVLHEAHNCPGGMMMFLAKLTQRGHNIKNMDDLMKLYNDSMYKHKTATAVASLPHGTIKRFTPITIAIVGASRRFLAQARTHQVGITYVSASLQYSDYTGEADFVVPYEITKADAEAGTTKFTDMYLEGCKRDMEEYAELAKVAGNDAAGYKAPQGLRNILIIQANHEAWMNFIRARGCSRNTTETQYVTLRIWEELLKTEDGDEMFHFAGPDCMYGMCREGKMCCGKPLRKFVDEARTIQGASIPRLIVEDKWPLLNK
jgi:thymidylate synthase (FAD)